MGFKSAFFGRQTQTQYRTLFCGQMLGFRGINMGIYVFLDVHILCYGTHIALCFYWMASLILGLLEQLVPLICVLWSCIGFRESLSLVI